MSEPLSKLKPCPFCGSKALEVCEGGHYPIFRVECSMCECNLFGTFDIKDKVILAWNNRVQGLDQLSPNVKELAKIILEKSKDYAGYATPQHIAQEIINSMGKWIKKG